MLDFSEFEKTGRKIIAKNLERYRKIVQENPGDVSNYEYYLLSLYNNKRIDEVFIECQKLLQLAPNDPYSYWIMGLVYTNRGHYQEGEKYLQKTLEVYPEFSHAMMDLGVNLLNQNRTEEGIILLHKYIELKPQDWRARYNLSLAYFQSLKNRDGYQEAKLAWRYHKSVGTFLFLVNAYDIFSKRWSSLAAIVIAIISIFVHNTYFLPLFVLAIRLCKVFSVN